MAAMAPTEACPCGSRKSYAACCEPFHLGLNPAPTAERLMRSRFSAFCRGQVDYLVATLHPSRRTPTDRDDLAASVAGTTWLRLQVLATEQGTASDDTGRVEFVAFLAITILFLLTGSAGSVLAQAGSSQPAAGLAVTVHSSLVSSGISAAMKATIEIGGSPPGQPAGASQPAAPITSVCPAASSSDR